MPAVLAGAMAFSAVSSVAGGFSAQAAANQQAKLQEQQGQIELDQSKVAATNEAFNQNEAIGKQRLAYLANGVSLEGSPTIVQDQATKYGQTQVDSILKQGAAEYNLARENAAVTRNQGRAALIAGFAQGIGTAASGMDKLSQATPGNYKLSPDSGYRPSNTSVFRKPSF